MGFPGSSAGKESPCNTEDLSSILGSGSSPGEGIGLLTPVFWGFPGGSVGKKITCNARAAGDAVSIRGLGRSPEEENGYPLQYSYLENSMDRGAW